jgi:predicted lipid-binding transport protein (Tim44 family)
MTTATRVGRELGMTPKSTALEISVICAFFIVLSLWGIVWDITSGLLTSGIDGIMLLGVCAMMAGIFLLIMLVHLTEAGVLAAPSFLRSKPAAKPAAAAPAATPKPAAAPATPASQNSDAPVGPAKPAAPVSAAGAAKPVAPASAAAPAAPTGPTAAPPKAPEE